MVVILLLLLSLAAVAGHNDCQRARGLELMLELSAHKLVTVLVNGLG